MLGCTCVWPTLPPTISPMGQSISSEHMTIKIYIELKIIAKTRRERMYSILFTKRPQFFFLKTLIFNSSHNIQMFSRLVKLFSLFLCCHYIRLKSWTRKTYIYKRVPLHLFIGIIKTIAKCVFPRFGLTILSLGQYWILCLLSSPRVV